MRRILMKSGDRVIVVTYAEYEPAESEGHVPTVVLVDERNVPRAPEVSAAGV